MDKDKTCMTLSPSVFSDHSDPDDKLWMQVIDELGIYPQSVTGGAGAYEQRTEFMDGWNAALMQATSLMVKKLRERKTQ